MTSSAYDGGPCPRHVSIIISAIERPTKWPFDFSALYPFDSLKTEVLCPLFSEKPSSTSDPSSTLIPSLSHHREPALKISKDLVNQFSIPFKYTMIGESSHARPFQKKSCLVFAKINLKGGYHLGYLDSKHMPIRLHHERDFNSIWLQELWYVDSFPMRVLRWTRALD